MERNKTLYKVELLIIKILPIILAGFYFIGTTLSLFNIDVTIITYLSGVSLIPLLFMYLSSYVFQFCKYHRMFLHYILFNIIANCIDWYIGIPLNNKEYFSIFLIITCIFLFVILYLYLKSRRNEKFNRPNSR